MKVSIKTIEHASTLFGFLLGGAQGFCISYNLKANYSKNILILSSSILYGLIAQGDCMKKQLTNNSFK